MIPPSNKSPFLFGTLFIFIILFSAPLSAQIKISLGNGNWNSAFNWFPFGVPTAASDVIITGNHQINLTSNSICRSLFVGTGGAAQLRFSDNTARSLTVTGNVSIASGAEFRVTANAHHTLVLGGDLTNSGTLDFYQNVNRHVTLLLNRNGNQNISGSGVLSNYGPIRLQMGSSFNNIADFSTSSFVIQTNFLSLVSGTFKYSTASTVNITPFATSVTIPSNGGLWMNAATAAMNLPAGIVVSGKLSNSNGTLNVGDASNEVFLYSGGTFSFTGGVTNVAGRFSGSVSASTCNFNMSGGTFSVPTVGSTNTTDAPFQIGASGSQFNMSGGTILVVREGGAGTQDLGYVNLAGSGTVNGGTVQIGNTMSPAGQTYKINSSALVPNLVLNNSTGTASLLTNALTVTNTIKITLGTLTSNNLGITLGGNWENNGGTFTPGTATVTFNSSSAQSIFKTGGEMFNHLRFSGTGTKTFSAPVSANNFSISTGSPVDVSASNHSLTVRGNFINSGTFNAQNGLVFFNGTSAQTIGGSSTTDFYNITLTNNSGAGLTHAENLIGTLTLSGGTFATNLQMFTMISNASGTARIAQITSTGDISGPVRVQRYVPGGKTGWALWGTPISSALSFADWDDNIFISCPTCPDGYVPSFPSIYSYDETAIGSYSNYLAYIPINTVNDPIVSNTGYWVYVGDGPTSTNPITVDVIGTVRKGNQTIPLVYSNYGSPNDDGWNLIHNPYPSPISWTSLKGATSNIDNAIYVYNADLNGGTGGNATYVNGVSSPAVGSGGIGDNIPMSQGFYVHSTGATALNATEANKVASAQAYLREASAANPQLVRVNMSSDNSYYFNDEVVVYTQAGATANFDNDYDAVKMAGQDPYAPYIEIEQGSDLMQVNAVAPIVGTQTLALKALTGYSGSYTISISEITFPLGACVNLFDRFTSTTTDLRNSNYVFNLLDTTTVARFVLSITLNPLQITSNLSQPTCQNSTGGQIIAIGNNAGPWNYYWKDAGGNPVKTSLNKPTADSLVGLTNGSFDLEVTTVGGCDDNQSTYSIIEKQLPYSGFNCVDTCFLDVSPGIVFNNITVNPGTQLWDFGDGQTSTDLFPYNIYNAVGHYLVRLISTSPSGCIDSASKNMVVVNKAVGIKNNMFSDGLKVHTLSGNHYLLQQELKASGNLSYTLTDAQAKKVLEQSTHSVSHIYIDLDLWALDAGVYFLSLQLDGKTTVIKLPVSK